MKPIRKNSPWTGCCLPEGYKIVRIRRGGLFNPEPESLMKRIDIGSQAATEVRAALEETIAHFPEDAVISIGRPEVNGAIAIVATQEVIDHALAQMEDIEIVE